MFAKVKLCAVVIIIMALCGCSANNRTQCNEVYLCDYKDIDVTEEMYSVSEGDLNTAMTMYAISIDEGLEDHTGLTDEIVKQYWGYESVVELREQALLDIVSYRIVSAVYEQILLNSHMDFHPDDSRFESYYSNRMSSLAYLSKQNGTTIPVFLEKNYQMTESEFNESEIDFFVTICILKEILNAEKHPNLQPEMDHNRYSLAQELGCPITETYSVLLDEDLFYSIAESKMYEHISEWYATEIYDAYVTAKNALEAIE